MNKSLFGSKKARTICATMAIIILTGIIGMTSKAQTERRASNIKSKGIFDYGNGTVVVDASDLTYLADEIDLLEETYKKETVRALNEMNTYFMLDDSTTHDPDESNLPLNTANILPFKSIINGILASQSIPTEKTYTGTLPGEENETTGNISAATAESISLGRAAWVDGELIVGNGGDNNTYYNQGYVTGIVEGLNSSKVEYVYHQHSGNSAEGTGCYTKPVYVMATRTEHCDGYISMYGDSTKEVKCGKCNHVYTNGGSDGRKIGDKCNGSVEVKYSTGVIDHYEINCGKTAETIESATIVFI